MQALPQAAQSVVVPSCVSQPGAVLQLPKPGEQAPIVQVPPGHEALALGNEQGTPQSPQLLTVVMLCSQPLSELPSQLLKPLLQLGEQSKLPALPLQLVCPFGLVQVLPHAAQFEVVPIWVSQPGAEVQSA